MFRAHRAMLILLTAFLAACSSAGQSTLPTASDNASRTPEAIKFGTGILLLAVDREHLVAGSIARISGFSAYSTKPVFQFYAKVPHTPTTGSLTIGGIRSDRSGHIYLQFDADSPYYQQGAIAVYNSISGSAAQDPDRLIVTSYFPILWDDSYFDGANKLAIDSYGRIYTAAADVAIIPPRANGIITPEALPGWPVNSIEPFSVALDTANNLYVSSSLAFGQAHNEVHKFSPYPTFAPIGSFGFSFCSQNCVITPFLSIPSTNQIYVTSAMYDQAEPPNVTGASFIASYPSSATNGSNHYPAPTRLIHGARTKLGWVHAIAACPNGDVYISQTAITAFPSAPSGILEFSAASNGDATPLRILAPGDNSIIAIGF